MPSPNELEILAALGIFAAVLVFVAMALILGVLAFFDEVVLRRKKTPSLRRPQEEK